MSAVDHTKTGVLVEEAIRLRRSVKRFVEYTDLALGKGGPSIDKKGVRIDVTSAQWHHGYYGNSSVSEMVANDDQLRWIREAIRLMAPSIIAKAIEVGNAEIEKKTAAARSDAESILAALEGAS